MMRKFQLAAIDWTERIGSAIAYFALGIVLWPIIIGWFIWKMIEDRYGETLEERKARENDPKNWVRHDVFGVDK